MAFDLRRFAESSEPVKYEDLDFDTFLSQPLDEQTLRSLRYMCDVEYHTSCFLRDLLVTPSHREEDAGGFMSMWNREQFWLGWAGALGAVMQSVVGNRVGSDFVAVRMVWGAANELSAVAPYRRLAAMTDHPALSPLLQRIAQQETRHVAFYTPQGRERLQAS